MFVDARLILSTDNTIILLVLAMVRCLRTCEFVVINESGLLICISDTQRGGKKNFHRFTGPRGDI